jgi:4-diphosphocytidyl-2-C-methyl-D-erythritol kinase
MYKTRFCPAKINLFLEVTGKLPNGYHELATLFAKLNFGDTLTLEATPANETRIEIALDGPVGNVLKADSSNLVWKAAQAFLDFFHLKAAVHITLEKHIPTGAGLGGGSSDAAGVLLCLCEIFNKDPFLLLDTAKKLGADVPLFMYSDTFLRGEGIGEKLTPVTVSGPLPYVVLAYPNTVVPTKNVFSQLRLPSQADVLTNLSKLDKLILYLQQGISFQKWKGLLFNRLEECVLPVNDSVRKTWQEIKSKSTDLVLMSGSGSTVFALVETEKQARQLVSQLQSSECTCFSAIFCGKEEDANHRDQNTPNGGGTSKSVC